MLPNLLTIGRIVAIGPICAFALLRDPRADLAAAILFAAVAATDWLDGFIARRWGLESRLGRMLDPIADKLLVGAALLLVAGLDRLSPAALVAALLILLRELLVSGLREVLAADRVALPVAPLAKWKTAAQLLALGLLLGGDGAAAAAGAPGLPVAAVGEALLWLAAALTLLTGAGYLRTTFRHLAAPRA